MSQKSFKLRKSDVVFWPLSKQQEIQKKNSSHFHMQLNTR